MRDRIAGLRRFATIPNLAAVTVIAASIAFGIQTITTHKASTKAQTAKTDSQTAKRRSTVAVAQNTGSAPRLAKMGRACCARA
jgi:hypothetical protein